MRSTYPVLIALLSLLVLGCADGDTEGIEQVAEDTSAAQTSVARERAAAQGEYTTWDFEDAVTGTLPSGWEAEQTNPRGEGAQWAVQQDPPAPSGDHVLALTDARGASGSTFNLAWTDLARFKDGSVSVAVKAGAGREDQGGGPIWRVQDQDNYYIARWNPLENNFRLYYVQNGSRKQLESANVDLPTDQWHTIRVEHEGDRIVAYLDDRQMFETTDDTFTEAGGVGVWTKADAATSFDDLTVTRVPAGLE